MKDGQEEDNNLRVLIFLIVLITGVFTLFYYSIINYLLFQDFGFLPAGRIVFASKFGYFDYLILPLGLFLGMKIYKENFLNLMTFRRLFKLGFITAICVSVCFSACIFVYLRFIEPNYFEKLIDLIRQLSASGKELTPFEKDMIISAKSIEETELFRNPLFYTIANFLAYFFIGTISSFLLANFLKSKRTLTYFKA